MCKGEVTGQVEGPPGQRLRRGGTSTSGAGVWQEREARPGGSANPEAGCLCSRERLRCSGG